MNIEENNTAKDGFSNALVEISKKLHSPPLLFGLGVTLVLGLIATIFVDEAHLLIWIILFVSILALGSWLLGRWIDQKADHRSADVQIRASDVGEKGQVIGIEGLPPTPGTSPPTLDLEAHKIDGRVRAIGYGTDKAPDREPKPND